MCQDYFVERLVEVRVQGTLDQEADMTENQWFTCCRHRRAERLQVTGHYRDMQQRVTSWALAYHDIDADLSIAGVAQATKRLALKATAKKHMQ